MSKSTILYAEDSESMRKLMMGVFEEYFPKRYLEVFENGTSLEERLKQGSEGVSLVFTDNSMPGIDGSEIIRKYYQTKEFKRIPFILFTAEENVGERLEKEGLCVYLAKPSPINVIIEAINKVSPYTIK